MGCDHVSSIADWPKWKLESQGTVLLRCSCTVKLLINTRWSSYEWNFLVLRAVFVWLMWCSVIFLLSEPYFQVSHLVISMKWWADWASWSWVEWPHSRKKFSLHERAWPVKLTQWNWPSVANLHHTSRNKSLLKRILHVFKALQNKMLLLLLRRHLFVLRGKYALQSVIATLLFTILYCCCPLHIVIT